MSDPREHLLSVSHVGCAVKTSTKEIEIFSDVSFDLFEGDVLFLSGRSGAGKSTLLRCLAHLQVYSGEVLFCGSSPKVLGIPTYRTRVMYVPQRPPQLPGTPRDFFKTILSFNSRKPTTSDRATRFAALQRPIDIGNSIGLDEALWDRNWTSLSGGESQRMSLAIALGLNTATVLLLDEPTASLDPNSTELVEKAFKNELHAKDCSVKAIIWVSHMREQERRMMTRIIHLEDGVAKEDDEPIASA